MKTDSTQPEPRRGPSLLPPAVRRTLRAFRYRNYRLFFAGQTVSLTGTWMQQVALGVVNAFDMPIRHAFVADLVERKTDFGNAIALNSFMFNGTRLVGPTLAGLIVASAGEGVCFLLNSLARFPRFSATLEIVYPLPP